MVQKVLKFFLCIFTFITATKYEAYNRKIVSGQTAARGQFPYQVSMRVRAHGQGHHTCGGAIISSRIIVTAAHCVYRRSINDFVIVVGSNALSGGQTYSLANMIYHSNYTPPPQVTYDIALLKTTQYIQFSVLVRPLPLMIGKVPRGASLVVSGWGRTSFNGSGTQYLQFTNLIAIDIQQCANAHAPNKIFSTQICTFTRPGQGVCIGDSGGPLVYRGRLAGVISWGIECAAGYPDVFTKVSAYIRWILQTACSM